MSDYQAGAGLLDIIRVACGDCDWATTRPASYAWSALLAHRGRDHGWTMPVESLEFIDLRSRNRWAA